MKFFRQFLLSNCLVIIAFQCHSQNLSKAETLYSRLGYQVSIPYFGDNEDLTSDQLVRLATANRLVGNSKETEMLYRNILRYDPSPIHYFYFAQALLMNDKPGEALENFRLYKSLLTEDNNDPRASNYIQFIQSETFGGLETFMVENERSLNSDNFEFSPFLHKDYLYFISSRPITLGKTTASLQYVDFYQAKTKDLWTNKDFNKIFRSRKDESGNWSNPTPLEHDWKNDLHIGPMFINPNSTNLYFTSSHVEDGFKKRNADNIIPLQIYFSTLIKDKWSEPEDLVEINTKEYNEAHPALSKDESIIVFSSDRPEGYGGMDLFIAHKKEEGWSTPINLGPEVNTKGNEVFPSLYEDGMLYFSSDGLGGFGGLDIFSGNLKGLTIERNSIKNLGAPMNSSKDDFGYTSEDHQSGYISSSRNSSLGRDDIYAFRKVQEKEKEEESILEEVVVENPAPTNIMESEKPPTEVPATTNEIVTTPAVVYNEKVVGKGHVLTLDKIYYDFDKASLRWESYPEIEKLTKFLNTYPDIEIEISAHTDSRGPDRYNKELSQRRAESVVDYLLQQEIAPHRIIAKGYGEEQLRNQCHNGRRCPEEDHQLNRRTEFKLLSVNKTINVEYTDVAYSDALNKGVSNTVKTNNGEILTEHTINEGINRDISPKAVSNDVATNNDVASKDINPAQNTLNTTRISKHRWTNQLENADFRSFEAINNQLKATGRYLISVGSFSKPEKRMYQMKFLGFDKISLMDIPRLKGIRLVLIGAVEDISKAQILTAQLTQLGFRSKYYRAIDLGYSPIPPI